MNMSMGACGDQKTTSSIILRRAANLLHKVFHQPGVKQFVYPGWKTHRKDLVSASPTLRLQAVTPLSGRHLLPTHSLISSSSYSLESGSLARAGACLVLVYSYFESVGARLAIQANPSNPFLLTPTPTSQPWDYRYTGPCLAFHLSIRYFRFQSLCSSWPKSHLHNHTHDSSL